MEIIETVRRAFVNESGKLKPASVLEHVARELVGFRLCFFLQELWVQSTEEQHEAISVGAWAQRRAMGIENRR